jgi:hypothetical protein
VELFLARGLTDRWLFPLPQNFQHQHTVQFGNEPDSCARMTLHRISSLTAPMCKASDSYRPRNTTGARRVKKPSLGETGPFALHETPSIRHQRQQRRKSSTSSLFPSTVSLPRAFTGLFHFMHRVNPAAPSFGVH